MPGKFFEIKGMDKLIKRFDGMERRMNNATAVNKKIGARGFKNVMQHFSEEKGENGQKWSQWKKGNKRFSSRPTKRGGSQMLVDSGTMRNSVRHKGLKNSAVIFIKSSYASFHHHGTSKMDKRRFMYIDNNTKQQMTKDLLEYIVNG